ncbi:MAG: hypothetical protein JWP48_1482 [Actinoallomurus sp.]|nr:hypothetical protein [Actinoallomurus sp.]
MTDAPTATTTAETAGPSARQSVTRMLGAIVAPSSMVTALLYFFGWSHAYWFFHYLGVDSSVLGFGAGDYLMRSIDTLYVPMTVTAAGGLVVLWGHALLRARLAAGARPRLLRVLIPAMAGTGLVLGAAGLWSVVTPTFLWADLAVAPLCLVIGVSLLVYTLHLRSLLTGAPPSGAVVQVLQSAVVFVLVGLGLFWAAVDYSAAVGQTRARSFVAKLPAGPAVVLYSDKNLSLTAPGITTTRCRDPRAAYHFRYDGLRFVLQSGDQYLLLPAQWSPREGVALLLPRTDSVRLEFTPTQNPARPAC